MNKIMIDDEIGGWGITAFYISSQLDSMSGDVEVYLSSRGGNVFEGIEIHNLFKNYNKGKIHMICTSLAASITSYIAMAGDKRSFYDNATFMYHNAWIPIAGDFNKLRKMADVSEGLSSILRKKYVAVSGKKLEQVTAEMNEEKFYFGDEILVNGFCDEIIKTDNDTTKSEAIALARESWIACTNNIKANFNEDEFVQMSAKLTKDGYLAQVQDDVEVFGNQVADTAEHENRLREIEIIKKGMNL